MNKERKCIKAHRQSLKRHERNKAVKSATRTAVKKAFVSLEGGVNAEAMAVVRSAQSTIDVAARKNVIPKKTADRKKSRLARRLNKAQTPAA